MFPIPTVVRAETRIIWDPDSLSSAWLSADMWVSYGTYNGYEDKVRCTTKDVEDSSTARWNESCDMSFASGDTLFLTLLDRDVFGNDTMGEWEWSKDELIELASSDPKNQTLSGSSASLVFRIERL